MSISFNADEIFEMAEEIERNAVRFYKEAAAKAAAAGTKNMFVELAGMEEGHEQTFAKMRRKLTGEQKEPITYDPDNQAAGYLRAMADFHGTEGKAGRMEKLSGSEGLEEILKIALQAEKNSIALYVGLKDLVAEKAGKNRIQAIIAEEMTHVSMLGGMLRSL